MSIHFGGRVELMRGDITKLALDAIVNAANSSLLGGGGVDGAIHRAAGRGLLDECRTLGGCPTGQSRITRGHLLPAKHVIHTVGPIWYGGTRDEPALLASCYRTSLDLAVQHGLATVAFPSISTGAYRFPIDRAAPLALTTTRDFLAAHDSLTRITFCCFSDRDLATYESAAALAFAAT